MKFFFFKILNVQLRLAYLNSLTIINFFSLLLYVTFFVSSLFLFFDVSFCVDSSSYSNDTPSTQNLSSSSRDRDIDMTALESGVKCVYVQDKDGKLVIDPSTDRPAKNCEIPTDKYAINKISELGKSISKDIADVMKSGSSSNTTSGSSSLQFSDPTVSCKTSK